MEQFYRVLTPKCLDDLGTIQRWRERQFTSTHGKVPEHWLAKWNKDESTNENDCDLESNGCTYTIAARKAFLDLAPSHKRGEIWPPDERNRVSEYEGVSAFDNIQRALKYGERTPEKRYVVFEGETPFKLPEDDGYAVKVTKELMPPMSREAFVRWISEGCRT